jgi:hypothetical protein
VQGEREDKDVEEEGVTKEYLRDYPSQQGNSSDEV